MSSSNASDRLTLREAVSIIKYAFKTVNKKLFIWFTLGGILLGGVLGGAFLVGDATRADMNGEKVVHSDCNVTDKAPIYYFDGKTTSISGYGTETSCGYFKVNHSDYQNIQVNETYNLTASVGNWANKPTVTSLEVSAK